MHGGASFQRSQSLPSLLYEAVRVGPMTKPITFYFSRYPSHLPSPLGGRIPLFLRDESDATVSFLSSRWKWWKGRLFCPPSESFQTSPLSTLPPPETLLPVARQIHPLPPSMAFIRRHQLSPPFHRQPFLLFAGGSETLLRPSPLARHLPLFMMAVFRGDGSFGAGNLPHRHPGLFFFFLFSSSTAWCAAASLPSA